MILLFIHHNIFIWNISIQKNLKIWVLLNYYLESGKVYQKKEIQIVLLFGVMISSGIFELVSLGSVIPFLSVISSPTEQIIINLLVNYYST